MTRAFVFCMSSILFFGLNYDLLHDRDSRVSAVLHPITLLAVNVWAEARGEPYKGKLAVAYNVMNRVGDKRWPDSVGDVIFQAWQFSWTNPGDPNRMKLDEIDWDDPAFVEAHKAASAAYYKLVPDPTMGANHYLNVKVVKKLPDWYDRGKIVATIGSHEFLRL